MVRLNKFFAYFIFGVSACLLVSINSLVFVQAKVPAEPIPVLAQAQTPPTNSSPPTRQVTTPDSSLQKPPPNQGKPVKVAVGVYISNVASIDQITETYNLSGYLSAKWKDPRLTFNPQEVGTDTKVYKPKEIWDPYLRKLNVFDGSQPSDVELFVEPDGSVQYSERFDVKLSSELDLLLFPFDSQTLQMIIESFEYDKNQVVFIVDRQQSGWGKEGVSNLAEWRVLGFDITTSLVEYAPDKTEYSRIVFGLKVKRNPGFHIWKVFLPLLLINIISWAILWINPKTDFGNQLSVGIVSMLTVIAYNLAMSSTLPRVSYLTFIDSFFLLSYISIFLLIFAAVSMHYFTSFKDQPNIALAIQRKWRWIHLLGFILGNLLLLLAFLVLSQ